MGSTIPNWRAHGDQGCAKPRGILGAGAGGRWGHCGSERERRICSEEQSGQRRGVLANSGWPGSEGQKGCGIRPSPENTYQISSSKKACKKAQGGSALWGGGTGGWFPGSCSAVVGGGTVDRNNDGDNWRGSPCAMIWTNTLDANRCGSEIGVTMLW